MCPYSDLGNLKQTHEHISDAVIQSQRPKQEAVG